MMDSRRRISNLILGAVSMAFFMIADWFLDAAGAGDEELGLIAHSNWPAMAMWRFTVSATIAAFAILLTWLGSKEAIDISLEVRPETKGGRFMCRLFRLCHVILVTYGSGFHIVLCLFPIFFKTVLALGGSEELAVSAVNGTGMQIIIPLMILYLICDIGVSVAWFWLVLSRKLRLSPSAVICCPLSSIVIDFMLKAIPLQFFKDFTVAFESLGWLMMYLALAAHVRNTPDNASE